MYINKDGFTYYRGSEQCHSRAPFLLLASDDSEKYADGTEVLYAAVRKVALSQCGHFMMGCARIGGFTVIVSGAYGNDSLPLHREELTERQRELFTRVSEELGMLYWHSSDAVYAPKLREFAQTLQVGG